MPIILEIQLEVQGKGPVRLFPTGIFGITSKGGPLVFVGPVLLNLQFHF